MQSGPSALSEPAGNAGRSAARRVISWALMLAAAALTFASFARLPGGDYYNEIRWLLATGPHTREFNRAALLIRAAEQRGIDGRASIYSRLLEDHSVPVVRGGLRMMLDSLENPRLQTLLGGETPPVARVFAHWLRTAPPEIKLEHAELCVRLVVRVAAIMPASAESRPGVSAVPPAGSPAAPITPQRSDAPRPGSPGPRDDRIRALVDPDGADLRWILAATLSRHAETRRVALRLAVDGPVEVLQRCVALAGGDPLDFPDAPAPTTSPALRDASHWPFISVRNHERIAACLNDGSPSVRRAAARVLAACRDERGLPVLTEWIRSEPQTTRGIRLALPRIFEEATRADAASSTGSDSTANPRGTP